MNRAERRVFRVAFGAWLFGIFAYFLPAATWNPVSRFNLTRALFERGSLIVDPDVSATGDRALVGEHWYSDKPPVVAVLAVPVYAATRAVQQLRGIEPDYRAFANAATPAFRFVPNRAYAQAFYVCSLSTSGAAGVAIGLMLLELLRRRTTFRAAFLGSSIALLGSPILPYSTSLYGHVPAAAFMLGAICVLDPLSSRANQGMPTRPRLLVAGACLALAAGAEYLVVAPVLAVGIWTMLRLPAGQRWRAALQIALGGLAPALLVAVYQTAVFGAPWKTGYSFESQPEFMAGHASGLMGIKLPRLDGLLGLTFGTRRGLFYLAPLALPAFGLTVRHIVKRRDSTVAAGLIVLLTLLALNAGYYMWWGGASAGPRHLVPGLAFLGVGVASAFRSKRWWLRAGSALLALVSVVNFVSLTLVGIEAPEYGDILSEWVWPRLLSGQLASAAGASNLGRRLGMSPLVSVLPLALWMGAGFVYLLLQTPASRSEPKTVGNVSRRPALGGPAGS
jgi:hypothetical protein